MKEITINKNKTKIKQKVNQRVKMKRVGNGV